MDDPGASMVRKVALLLQDISAFTGVFPLPSAVAPTLIADEMQEGALMPPVYPLLPAAMTVAIPTLLS